MRALAFASKIDKHRPAVGNGGVAVEMPACRAHRHGDLHGILPQTHGRKHVTESTTIIGHHIVFSGQPKNHRKQTPKRNGTKKKKQTYISSHACQTHAHANTQTNRVVHAPAAAGRGVSTARPIKPMINFSTRQSVTNTQCGWRFGMGRLFSRREMWGWGPARFRFVWSVRVCWRSADCSTGNLNVITGSGSGGGDIGGVRSCAIAHRDIPANIHARAGCTMMF